MFATSHHSKAFLKLFSYLTPNFVMCLGISVVGPQILTSGEIVFEMGPKPNKNWANEKKDIPYSLEYKSPLMPKSVLAVPLRSAYLITSYNAFLF